ncbi:MAG: YggS family pyridoxal phosphate-dependent enzyme [Cyanobacteriota bacterium]|jgi:pyridoxal phosphate enzyme (YggS family)
MTSELSQLRVLQEALPPGVKLVAVTKTVDAETIRQAYGAGVRDFGESRVQEALPKLAQLADLTDITWHFIGRLQANKARKIVEHFSWIHSVDSWPLTERLERIAGDLKRRPQILLQVKLWPDESKTGWSEMELREALPRLQALVHLQPQGLMAILPLGLTPAERLAAFQKVAGLAQSLPLPLEELSMGMSGDYPQALAAGATLIRIGSLIFGRRSSSVI